MPCILVAVVAVTPVELAIQAVVDHFVDPLCLRKNLSAVVCSRGLRRTTRLQRESSVSISLGVLATIAPRTWMVPITLSYSNLQFGFSLCAIFTMKQCYSRQTSRHNLRPTPFYLAYRLLLMSPTPLKPLHNLTLTLFQEHTLSSRRTKSSSVTTETPTQS